MIVLQWSLIFAGALLLWHPGLRLGAMVPLVIGYALGAANGALGLPAAIPILLLLLAACLIRSQQKTIPAFVSHLIVLLLAAPLILHLIPGFHNLVAVGPERLTPDAVPFRLYLNLDKPLLLFWLLLVCPQIISRRPLPVSLAAGIVAGGVTVVICLGAALTMHLVGWAPKWPEWGWLWVLDNLLLVAGTEEALFRGYVQAGVERFLAGRSYRAPIAVLIGAMLFALIHFPGGWQLMLVAGIAGIGYGVAYRHGGMLAAVLAHFGLNLVHFSLLTYPMLAR